MNRCFVSSKQECKGGCKYCFAKWTDYQKFPQSIQVLDNTIVYPNCDGNFFDGNCKELLEIIRNLNNENIIVSISTKFNLDNNTLFKLQELNDHLKRNNNGMLKLSVSFSCEKSILEIEPGTMVYQERIDLVRRITGFGIPYVTVIKPILPFIDIDEYKKIIDDTIKYSNMYVIGELYVQRESTFFEKYINDKYCVVESKEVSWNGKNGRWMTVSDLERRRFIVEYIKESKGMAFESDQDALVFMKEKSM